MLSPLRRHLNYANVTVTVLLFLVIGGGTAAALQGRNTVFSGDITNGHVKRADLDRNAVDSSRIATDSIRGGDVREDSLSGVGIGITGGVWEDISGAPSEQRPASGISSTSTDWNYLAPVDLVARDLTVATNGPGVPPGETVEVALLLDSGDPTDLSCTIAGPNEFTCDSGASTVAIEEGRGYAFLIRSSSPAVAGETLEFGWRAVSP